MAPGPRAEFLAKGLRGTTMDAVARRARISKQSLYAAWPSKDALYAAVVRDGVDQGHDSMAPHARALAGALDARTGLSRMAEVLQAGILSTPVLRMRALVAAEADSFPEVAEQYAARSWDRNLGPLAGSLRELDRRGLLTVPDADVAAEQFVWLVVGGPLNRSTLRGPGLAHPPEDLRRVADEAVTTFLARYGAGG